ncbi:MAG: sulfate adenylyltransferase subunit 1 [Solirubrobacterales bacterium]
MNAVVESAEESLALGERELLRFVTAGSVDDGKSTLIGRLLYDSKQVLADQLEHVELTSARRGEPHTNLALLTDGLRAEREQGITIDVAYRYFTTARRKFILADSPGHVQYTRNMVTGASTANLALVLVDVRQGVVEPTRRHAFLASLLGIRHLVVCVKKMDLAEFAQDRFEEVEQEFRDFATRLDVPDITFIPISALDGDNVVERSQRMPWYQGPSLLYHLEHVHIASDRNLQDCRLPVQYVINPASGEHQDFRGYAGQVAGGVLKPGDEVVILPAGLGTTIAAIHGAEGEVAEAFAPMGVTVQLDDELDVSRGDMICRPHNHPEPSREVEATVCWMADAPMRPAARYVLKHTTRTVKAKVDAIRHRVDVNTLHRDTEATELGLNDIGRVHLRLGAPIMSDPYRRNRTTGSFILVDESSNETVGAGMVSEHEQA